MPVETPSLFAKVIQDHLELKERNSQLERNMPLGHYKSDDPFENHPLFKSEEQARLEETMDGEVQAPGEEVMAHATAWPGQEPEKDVEPEDSLWSRSRDFDWGD
ncbi:MAG: hypothetical protein QOE36_3214 [Gaiellaceae bacterium]|jgi:hypothetical protein|nr:hypothetical protein [Gaiellaceae bacterium]